jgi:hypothetical protein
MCDAPGVPSPGAPDQVLSLNLKQAQRVVFDMEGSTYATILDVRQGATCPGQTVLLTNNVGACFVGFDSERSFLDLELTPGQYWIVIGGYDLAKGPWALDVRVLPP